MRGIGFVCDHCGRRWVGAGDLFVAGYAAPIPDGWKAVGVSPVAEPDAGPFDFCGWDCVADFAREHGTVRVDGARVAETGATP